MSDSMNHEAVYRTAPATPGLLNMKVRRFSQSGTKECWNLNFSLNKKPPDTNYTTGWLLKSRLYLGFTGHHCTVKHILLVY